MSILRKLSVAALSVLAALASYTVLADNPFAGPYGWSGNNGVANQCLISNGPAVPPTFQSCSAGGGGTVSSVGLTLPSWLTVSGSPVTGSGVLAVSAATGQTSHQFVGTGSGTSVSLQALAAADIPSPLTSNTSGNAATATALAATPAGCSANQYATGIAASGNLTCAQPTLAQSTGTLAATAGGTAQSTYTTGDTLYASASNTLSKLAGSTSATKQFLTQTGNGTTSAAPAWGAIVAGDIPVLTATQSPAFTGDVTKSSGSLATTVNTVHGGSQVGYIFVQSGLPFILPSSGSMGNNGALTITTALPLTYAKAYICLQVNVIASGVAAGCYYATCSSTTVCTLFNNVYSSGVPTVPGSPTAFSTTGPGAYTQTTSAVTLQTYTLPGNSLGLNGALRLTVIWGFAGSTNAKTLVCSVGGSTIFTQAPVAGTTVAYYGATEWINRGATAVQIARSSGANGAGTAAATQTAIDTTANQTFLCSAQLANAADFTILEGLTSEILPSSP